MAFCEGAGVRSGGEGKVAAARVKGGPCLALRRLSLETGPGESLITAVPWAGVPIIVLIPRPMAATVISAGGFVSKRALAPRTRLDESGGTGHQGGRK